jgi:thiamine-phosphate pyrophosphorylase
VSLVVCVITDRSKAPSVDLLVERVRAAARAGVDLVQIRERDLDGGPLLDLVERCVRSVQSTRTRVLVNDRLDVALAAGAHGVHLRHDSFAAPRVRLAAPRGFLVGRSVHDVASARTATEAGGLDYLIFGSVFATASKPGRSPAGLDALAAVAAATPLPVLAVGGVTAERIPAVSRAGAMGIAAIGLFADSPEERLSEIVERIRGKR